MSSKRHTVTALLFCLTATAATSLTIDLIKDYLSYYNVQTALFATCESSNQMLEYVIKLHSTDSYVNVCNLNNESDVSNTLNFTHFFVRSQGFQTVIVDLRCEHVHSFLRQSSEKIFFHLERRWLIFSKNLVQSYYILEQENINMDADVTLVTRLDSGDYQISDVYNPSKLRGGRLNVTTIGVWNQYRGFQLTTEQTKIERRRNLGGLTFLSVMTLPSPLPDNQTFIEHIKSTELAQLNFLDRSAYKLFELIMEMHNFKVLIRRAKYWMGIDPNGRWTGTLGMVQRREVDLAISGARYQDDRYGQVEATTHYTFAQVKFIFQHPKSLQSSAFLSPFEGRLWLALVLIGLFIAASLRLSFVLENEVRTTDYTYCNSILMVFGILFQQGYAGSVSRLSSKLLALNILLFSFIIFQFYSTFVISSLLIEPPKSIKTMKQLVQSRLKCFVDDVPYIIDNLRHAKDESAQQIYQQILLDNTRIVPIQPKGLELLKKVGYALNTDASYAYPKLKEILSDKEICNLQEVSYIQKLPCHPTVTIKSPLRELIKISLRKFFETGIMDYQWNIWLGKKPKCENSAIDIVQVDWLHFRSSLYMLSLGMALSTSILLFENVACRMYTGMSLVKVRN